MIHLQSMQVTSFYGYTYEQMPLVQVIAPFRTIEKHQHITTLLLNLENKKEIDVLIW